MSKKSRKNPSKPAAGKVAKRAAKPAAKTPAKAATKTPVKAAAKSPAKKVAAKPAKPATKAVSRTAGKAAAKVSKTPIAKKAPAARNTVVKAAPKKEPKATQSKATQPKATGTATDKAAAKSSAQPTPKPAAPPKPAPEKVAPMSPSFATEGAQAPAFQLPRDGGATISLSDYAGQKVVIFFYPRASTPGCTKEAIDFTRLSGEFQAAGAALLGVSADPLKAQESFRDKHDLAMPLLSDTTQAMLKSYGAWGEKSMYGKVFEGVLRTTVLIDADGKVARIWRGVKVDGHADAVLQEARRI
jgi:peroxiredoxin Q/BCP